MDSVKRTALYSNVANEAITRTSGGPALTALGGTHKRYVSGHQWDILLASNMPWAIATSAAPVTYAPTPVPPTPAPTPAHSLVYTVGASVTMGFNTTLGAKLSPPVAASMGDSTGLVGATQFNASTTSGARAQLAFRQALLAFVVNGSANTTTNIGDVDLMRSLSLLSLDHVSIVSFSTLEKSVAFWF